MNAMMGLSNAPQFGAPPATTQNVARPRGQLPILGHPNPPPRGNDDAEPNWGYKIPMPQLGDRPLGHQDERLFDLLKDLPLVQYRGHITSLDDYREKKAAYMGMIRHPASNRDADVTLPKTNGEVRRYVGLLYSAIMDFSRVEQQPSRSTKAVDKIPASDPEFAVKANLARVLSVVPRAVEIELLCWDVLMAAIDSQKGITHIKLCGGENAGFWEPYRTFADRWSQICEVFRVREGGDSRKNTGHQANHYRVYATKQQINKQPLKDIAHENALARLTNAPDLELDVSSLPFPAEAQPYTDRSLPVEEAKEQEEQQEQAGALEVCEGAHA
jgi:hypothetical protein